MSKLSYIVAGSGRIAAVANGSPYTVDVDHPNYKQIKECLKTGDADAFVTLADIPKSIESYGDGKVTVKNGQIFYGDRQIHNTLSDRILWMMDEGFDVKPMLAFLENLMQNPSARAVNELYSWMEHQDVPITTDGCWIGYKYLNTVDRARGKGAVKLADEPTDKQILVDVHSGTVRQWLGKVVSVPRNTVDDNWGVACSEGLHVGSSRYQFSGNVRVLVKVNPKDVVSVPQGEIDKCRVCAYEVVDIFKEVYATPVVGPNGEKVASSGRYDPNDAYYEEEEDYDDDDFDYDDDEVDGDE